MNLLPHFLFIYCLLLCTPTRSTTDSNHNSTTFLRLLGAHKGECKPGIGHVKSYLRRLGYLNDFTYSHSKEIGKQNNDLFDDTLKTAILTYQKFFKLNKTGVLDHETVSMMSTPRCGNPDILRSNNISSNERFHRHYHIFPGRPRRTKSHLYVDIPKHISQEHSNAIYQAFRDWEFHIPVIFLKSFDTDVVDIKVRFFNGPHNDGVNFDGNDGILAHASGGKGSTLHFDSAEKWRVGAVPDGYDIGTVARHEIGHLLGLDHSEDVSSIMYPKIHPGTIKRITNDDIAGLKDLYGPS